MTKKRLNLCDKEEFNAIDVGRVVFSLFVMCIHLNPFRDLSPGANYIFRNIPARLGVPFFFLAAGFFIAGKINGRNKVFSYLSRLLRMYIICTILYLPAIAYFYKNAGYSVLRLIFAAFQDFFVLGSYIQLWYFLSLIAAVFLLYILVNRGINDRLLLFLALMIYALGAAGNVFSQELSNTKLLYYFYRFFGTTRCGLFFGFPLVCIGYLIKKHSNIIPKRSYIPPFLLFFIMLVTEVLVIRKTAGADREAEVWFMLLPCSVSVFLAFCCADLPRMKKDTALHLRRLSVVIFQLHNLVAFYLMFVTIKLKITLNSVQNFFVVLIITILMGEIIIYLSEKKRFGFFKALF